MKKAALVLLVVLLFVPAGMAWAAQEGGDNEVGASMSLSHETYKLQDAPDPTTMVNFNMNIIFGHFFTPSHEAGLMFLLTYSMVNPGAKQSVTPNVGYLPGGFYRYNFMFNPRFVPYIGASLGYVGESGKDFTVSGFYLGGEVGLKFFLTEKTSLYIAYLPLFQFTTFMPKNGTDENVNYLRNLLQVGVSVAF